jgi:hypothetical protein
VIAGERNMVKQTSSHSKKLKSKKILLKRKNHAGKKPVRKNARKPSYAELIESRIMAECFLAAAINQLQEELVFQPQLENRIAALDDVLNGLVNHDFSVKKSKQMIEETCLEFSENTEEKILAAVEFLNLTLGSLYKIETHS